MISSSHRAKGGPERNRRHPRPRLWREPLVHFFILGLAVFGLFGLLEEKPEPASDPLLVEVSSADLEWFRTMWRKRMGREPTVEELRAQVNQLVREQILSREAVSLGLDEGDRVLRRRLAQKMEFLFADLSGVAEPSEAELKKFLQENSGAYEVPQEMSFSHVYFNADARGNDAAAAAARALAERLNEARGGSPDLSGLGDAFLLPLSYSNVTLADLRGKFGGAFAGAVWGQEPRIWRGPVESGYGMHAVCVHERVEATLPGFGELRERLRADWRSREEHALTEKVYQEIRSRYRVRVEGMPYKAETLE